MSSEFNEMQRQLKLSKEEQAKYEVYRKELISSVSHDLRTPLTTIKGYIKGILDGIANTDEKRLKYLLAVQTRTEDLERDYLVAEGMEADLIPDGRKGLESFRKGVYQAVILDLMLPGMNGFDVCKAIRKDSDVPILLVTARKEDIDKIKGLGLGADDYVVKPFSPVELIARVKAHIQIHRKLKTGERENFIQAGPLAIYPDSYLAYKNNRPLELTGREFELLLFLARNPNIVFSKERLFDHIWGMEAVGDISTVTVHINKLRDKIEDDPSEPQFIKTVWGVGYRFQKGRG